MDIDGWLRRIGLERYARTFRENGIDLSVLPDLTDQDLEKLGVLLGHRRKLLRAIADLEAIEKSAPAGAAATTGPAAPRPLDTAERRQLTIMFCDLVGSTALSTRLNPEDMREIVGAYHRGCADLITRAGGFVARYMGDGVLAYFGYPQALEHDAERAVRAALSLVAAVPKLKTVAGVPLQVRVGNLALPAPATRWRLDHGREEQMNLVGASMGHARPQKITFAEMHSFGVRGLLIYWSDYRCSHSIAISADPWPDQVLLSDLEPALRVLGLRQEGLHRKARFEELG